MRTSAWVHRVNGQALGLIMSAAATVNAIFAPVAVVAAMVGSFFAETLRGRRPGRSTTKRR